MIELLSEISDSIYALLGPDFLLSFFIKSSIIMVTTLLIQGLLKKYSASVRYSVWNISLIAILVIPFIPNLEQPIQVSLYSYEAFADQSTKPEVNANNSIASIPTAQQKVTKNLNHPQLSALEIASIVWLIGIVVLIAFLVREILWLRTLLLDGLGLTNTTNSILKTCKKQIGLNRSVKVLINARVEAPLTYGFLKPVIVLPAIAKEWEEEKIKIVLLHELIHIKRNDYFTNLIASLGVIICWYNPLAWFVLKYQKAECEKACDENVLANDINPGRYAIELLKLAQGNPARSRLKLNSMVSILGANSVKERIKLIISGPSKKRAVSFSLVVALSLFVLFEAFSLSSLQFYRSNKSEISNIFPASIKESDVLKYINSPDVLIRRKVAQQLIRDYNTGTMTPIFNQLKIETDPEVTSSLVATIAKFENSKEFYLVARQINSEDLKVKLQVLEYMQVISCFPSYLVVEASINDQNQEISAAAQIHLQNFDKKKLKRSIRNFANNFKYNNSLSFTIGKKMSWIHGYQSIDELSEILKSDDSAKKKELGERLLIAAANEEFAELKEIIKEIK